MAKFQVIKGVRDKKTNKPIKVGTIIERTLKEVAEFEKKHGTDYLKRVEEE